MNESTFHATIEQRARALPEHVAFRTPERTWTYSQIDRAANRIARALAALDVGPGDRVACLTRHMAECTLLVLAAQKIGAVCMPVNWRLAAPEVEYILVQGEARFMMADEEFLPLLQGLQVSELRKVLRTLPGSEGESLEAWSAAQPDSAPAHRADAADPALQLYSSGTTGQPKGVVMSHRNLIGVGQTLGHAMGCDAPGSVWLNVAPTFHIGGLGIAFVALYAGGATVTAPDFVPARVLGALVEHRVTHAFLVPAMIQFLLQVPGVQDTDFSALRAIGYGAAPISEKVLIDAMQTFRCRFVQVYGLTETTGTIVALAAEDHDPGGPRAHLLRAAGKPCPGTDLRIVDVATGEDLPEGEIGEIWIRSPQNMIGYWRNEKATQEAYPEGRDAQGIGWFRSGDAGSIREGYLFIEDRIKDMIITGAENVYPVEVENVLMKHAAVLDCAVIAVPDDKWGESVKACVVRRPGADLSPQDLIAFSRERLAHYKCPKSVDFMDALPRNPSGKLLKNVLRQPYWQGRTRNVN